MMASSYQGRHIRFTKNFHLLRNLAMQFLLDNLESYYSDTAENNGKFVVSSGISAVSDQHESSFSYL